MPLITGSIARNATGQYLIYSEADFELFLPQGRHVVPIGVKLGMEEGTFGPLLPHEARRRARRRPPPPCQISPQSVQPLGYRTPKTEIFTEI